MRKADILLRREILASHLGTVRVPPRRLPPHGRLLHQAVQFLFPAQEGEAG